MARQSAMYTAYLYLTVHFIGSDLHGRCEARGPANPLHGIGHNDHVFKDTSAMVDIVSNFELGLTLPRHP